MITELTKWGDGTVDLKVTLTKREAEVFFNETPKGIVFIMADMPVMREPEPKPDQQEDGTESVNLEHDAGATKLGDGTTIGVTDPDDEGEDEDGEDKD